MASNPFLIQFDKCTEEHKALGALWYQTANTIAFELSRKYGVTLEQAAGTIAVLSPSVPWEVNIAIAEMACQRITANKRIGTIAGYPHNKRKAVKILRYNDLSVVKGMKVSAFYDNILQPMKSERVTLDRWMFRILTGSNDRKVNDKYFQPAKYRKVESEFINVSKQLNYVPNQLQAILWLSVREGGK